MHVCLPVSNFVSKLPIGSSWHDWTNLKCSTMSKKLYSLTSFYGSRTPTSPELFGQTTRFADLFCSFLGLFVNGFLLLPTGGDLKIDFQMLGFTQRCTIKFSTLAFFHKFHFLQFHENWHSFTTWSGSPNFRSQEATHAQKIFTR